MRYAGRLYAARAPAVVLAFVAVFIALRELLLIVLAFDMPPLALLLTATLVQAVVPAFVGSVLVAAAVLVLWGEADSLRKAWAALTDLRADVYRAAGWSAALALFFFVTLGPVGIIVQPMVIGPPLLIHEIVLKRHRLHPAWERTKQMLGRDNRQLAYLLAIPALVGLVLSATLRAFGVLSGDIPGVLRGIGYFAAQGALIGAAMPFVVAVGLLLYADLAATLGGDEAS